MTRYRLSPLAEETLEDILVYSFETFGEAQANKYREALLARLDALVEGRSPLGRPCEALVGDDAPNGLFYVKQGGHFIIYRTIGDEIFVVDFVHEVRDLPARLRELAEDKGE